MPLAPPWAQCGCLSLLGTEGPASGSTRHHCLDTCQNVSVEFALENSWFLLTTEGRAVAVFVPGLRVSVHTETGHLTSHLLSVTLSHSLLLFPFWLLQMTIVKRPCVHASHLHK